MEMYAVDYGATFSIDSMCHFEASYIFTVIYL